MKKISFLLSCMFLSLALLTGCGANSKNNSSDSNPQPKNKDTASLDNSNNSSKNDVSTDSQNNDSKPTSTTTTTTTTPASPNESDINIHNSNITGHLLSPTELSKEQEDKIFDLTAIEDDNGEIYWRQRSEIIDGVNYEKRISLEKMKEIVKNNSTFVNMVAELQKIHGLPDAEAGSGISRYEYWIDDDGKQKIVLWLAQISFVDTTTDKEEILFNEYSDNN